MAKAGASNDGKSGVDKPFLPERQGQAKQAFEKTEKAPEKAATAERASGGQDRVPDSIKKHKPGLEYNMKGGGQVRAAGAENRITKEAAVERAKHAAMAVSKKMEKSGGINQDKSKSLDKGRE